MNEFETFAMKELVSGFRKHRLTLTYRSVRDGGADFDFLSWTWKDKEIVRITADDFDRNNPTERWIADITDFAPGKSQATLLIGEGDRPQGESRTINYYYSWRIWDLSSNKELEMLEYTRDHSFPSKRA